MYEPEMIWGRGTYGTAFVAINSPVCCGKGGSADGAFN